MWLNGMLSAGWEAGAPKNTWSNSGTPPLPSLSPLLLPSQLNQDAQLRITEPYSPTLADVCHLCFVSGEVKESERAAAHSSISIQTESLKKGNNINSEFTRLKMIVFFA